MSARSGRLSMTFDFYVIYRLMRRRLAHLPHFENATSIMYWYKSMKQHTESHMENNVSFRVPSLSRSLHLFAACLAQYSSNVLTVWVNTLFSATKWTESRFNLHAFQWYISLFLFVIHTMIWLPLLLLLLAARSKKPKRCSFLVYDCHFILYTHV